MSERKFKVNNLVEVTIWEGVRKKDWIIVGIASNGQEAILRHIGSGEQTIVELIDLKHQTKEA